MGLTINYMMEIPYRDNVKKLLDEVESYARYYVKEFGFDPDNDGKWIEKMELTQEEFTQEINAETEDEIPKYFHSVVLRESDESLSIFIPGMELLTFSFFHCYDAILTTEERMPFYRCSHGTKCVLSQDEKYFELYVKLIKFVAKDCSYVKLSDDTGYYFNFDREHLRKRRKEMSDMIGSITESMEDYDEVKYDGQNQE